MINDKQKDKNAMINLPKINVSSVNLCQSPRTNHCNPKWLYFLLIYLSFQPGEKRNIDELSYFSLFSRMFGNNLILAY